LKIQHPISKDGSHSVDRFGPQVPSRAKQLYGNCHNKN